MMAEVEDRLERDLKMIGATAIEDRLQDQLGSLALTQPRPSSS
jgi:magnesium-transporting ATPase (P-type)